jgi:hypothetical protein
VTGPWPVASAASGLAIGTGMGTAWLQAVGDAVYGMPVDHLLAGPIRIQGLCHEERQGVGWWIESLPMQWQVLLYPVKQRGAGQ